VINDEVNASPRIQSLINLREREQYFEEGYDSDGERGPFCDVHRLEGEQMFDEEVPMLPSEDNNEEDEEDIHEVNIDEALYRTELDTPIHIDIDDEVLKKMTKPLLKIELKMRKKAVGGNKKELLDRLQLALKEKAVAYTEEMWKWKKLHDTEDEKKEKKQPGMSAFPATAWWRDLVPETTIAIEPDNPTFKRARAPTVPQQDIEFVPTKHNFSATFHVPEFTASKDVFERTRKGGVKCNESGEPKTYKTMQKHSFLLERICKKERRC